MECLVELQPDDAGEVLTLQRAAYVTEAQAYRDPCLPPLLESLDQVSAELAEPEVIGFGWRESNGRLVAAVRVRVGRADPSRVEVCRLAVAPDWQGRQLGSSLLRGIEERLPNEVTELRLFTGEHSAGNLRLYGRLGYIETCRESTPDGYALVHLRKSRTGAS